MVTLAWLALSFALESLSGGLRLSDLDPFVYRPWLPFRGACVLGLEDRQPGLAC